MRLVSVVMRARSPRATTTSRRVRRSSIWFLVGTTVTSGSSSPVGRMTCSTIWSLSARSRRARRRRDEDHLGHEFHELVEVERTVVQGARQPEAVLDQGLLARAVAGVLAAHLGHGHVGLVDHHEKVLGEVVEQREGPLAPAATVEVGRVVLDARADPVCSSISRSCSVRERKALGLEQLALGLEERQLLLELVLDAATGPLQGRGAGGVVRGGKERELLDLAAALLVTGLKNEISSTTSSKNETRTASLL
jgi:hypothetical protein